jgi:hypothetical protein
MVAGTKVTKLLAFTATVSPVVSPAGYPVVVAVGMTIEVSEIDPPAAMILAAVMVPTCPVVVTEVRLGRIERNPVPVRVRFPPPMTAVAIVGAVLVTVIARFTVWLSAVTLTVDVPIVIPDGSKDSGITIDVAEKVPPTAAAITAAESVVAPTRTDDTSGANDVKLVPVIVSA